MQGAFLGVDSNYVVASKVTAPPILTVEAAPHSTGTNPMTPRIQLFVATAILFSLTSSLNAQTENPGDFTATDPIAIGLLKKAEELEAQLNQLKTKSNVNQGQHENTWLNQPNAPIGNESVVGTEPVPNATGKNPWTNFMGVDSGSPFEQAQVPIVFGRNRSHFELGVDGIFVSRGDVNGSTFISDDFGPLLSTSDIDLGLNNGNRVNFGYFNQARSGLEFVYYGIQGDTQNVAEGTNVLPTFFGFTPGTPDSSFTVDYLMDIDSYELNLWGNQRGNWRFGVGYRAVDLAEQFDIIRTNDPSIGFSSETENRMRGGQLLVEHQRRVTRMIQFFAIGKFGWFDNELSVFADSGVDSSEFAFDGSSFLADINTGLQFTLTDYLQFEVGYQALLFTDVASALDQNASLDLATGGGAAVFGNAPFHGFSFGGKLAY